jgi:hypothetical protein
MRSDGIFETMTDIPENEPWGNFKRRMELLLLSFILIIGAGKWMLILLLLGHL